MVFDGLMKVEMILTLGAFLIYSVCTSNYFVRPVEDIMPAE